MDANMDMNGLAEACKALGHPARLMILAHLLKEDRCQCGGIVEIMPLAQSTVSQHLKVLKEAGLVTGEIEGPKTCYCADKDALARLAMAIQALKDSSDSGRDK
jgi:DNA-binding transcriptional ArsR family regulator